jgi:RNA 2',3'-cyclic 3'-phosphodiesterase
MSEQLRSFIAFDLESEQVLNKLAFVQKQLVETGADVRAVAPQNIHLTIRFLGNISPPMVDKVHDAMKNVKFTPFIIQIKGLGVFPSPNYPRVVWAAMIDGVDQLKSIFNQLEPQIRALGFEADAHGFSPHLTIARVKSPKNKQNLVEFVTRKADYELGTIKAEYLRLKRSQLSPKGPTYTTQREVCPAQEQK